MTTISSRTLAGHARDVLKQVADGNSVTVTANGKVVATINPVAPTRAVFMPKEQFLAAFRQADPQMRHDLEALGTQESDTVGPLS